MNQPQPLFISLDFQGYLVCQIPKDALEVELKIKPKWGKFHPPHRPVYQNREIQGVEEGQSLQDPLKKKTTQNRRLSPECFPQIQVDLLTVVKGWGFPLRYS